MHIVIGLVVAILWFGGNWIGRVLLWPCFTVGLVIWGDDWFGRVAEVVGPGAGHGVVVIWLLLCAVLGWIISSVPAYLLRTKDTHGTDARGVKPPRGHSSAYKLGRIIAFVLFRLSAYQPVAQNNHGRNDALDTRWAGKWIRAHK